MFLHSVILLNWCLATGATDWEWWNPIVPSKLKQLHKDGYCVLFFTNQAGIEKLKVTPEELQKKVEAIIKELEIPVMVSSDLECW